MCIKISICVFELKNKIKNLDFFVFLIPFSIRVSGTSCIHNITRDNALCVQIRLGNNDTASCMYIYETNWPIITHRQKRHKIYILLSVGFDTTSKRNVDEQFQREITFRPTIVITRDNRSEHNDETICDMNRKLFIRPSLSNLRLCLKNIVNHLDIPYDISSLLSTQHPSAVQAIFHFFNETNFTI